MSEIVYISGPMTGIKDLNYPLFNSIAKRLSDAGYAVENPADNYISSVNPSLVSLFVYHVVP